MSSGAPKAALSKLPRGWDLAFWDSGEHQVITERLDAYDEEASPPGRHSNVQQGRYCPARADLWRSMDVVPLDRVQVAIVGQDPYPKRLHCTGVAFSVPGDVRQLPASLVNIFKEYEDDLHYPAPKNGDLTKWCEQGVLLCNAYPSCEEGKPGSHHWVEYDILLEEMVRKLDERKVVFIFLGAKARKADRFVRLGKSICTSHPSPLGANKGFFGSRIFSTANDLLSQLGKEPINWRL